MDLATSIKWHGNTYSAANVENRAKSTSVRLKGNRKNYKDGVQQYAKAMCVSHEYPKYYRICLML